MAGTVLSVIGALAGLATLILGYLWNRERRERIRAGREWKGKEQRYERMAKAVDEGDVATARELLAKFRRELRRQAHRDSGRRGLGEDYEG